MTRIDLDEFLKQDNRNDRTLNQGSNFDPGTCPYCGSEDFERNVDTENLGDTITVSCKCRTCSLSWDNYYDLALQQTSEVTNKDIFYKIYHQPNMLPLLSDWIQRTYGEVNKHAKYLINLYLNIEADVHGEYPAMIYGMVHTAFERMLEEIKKGENE